MLPVRRQPWKERSKLLPPKPWLVKPWPLPQPWLSGGSRMGALIPRRIAGDSKDVAKSACGRGGVLGGVLDGGQPAPGLSLSGVAAGPAAGSGDVGVTGDR